MSERGTFGGTEDAVPTARDLAGLPASPAGPPARHDEAPPPRPRHTDAEDYDDNEAPGIQPAGRYYNATSHNTYAPLQEDDVFGRPQGSILGELVDTVLLSGPPRDHVRTETHYYAPQPAVRRQAPVEARPTPTSWPVLDPEAQSEPLGGLLRPSATGNLPAVPTSVAPVVAPTPVPIDCGPVEWRGQQALRGALALLVGGMALPGIAAAPPSGLMLLALLLLLVGLVLGALMIRPAVAPAPAVTAGVETLRVDAGWASFELPWNEIESVSVEQRTLHSREGDTETAFLQVRLNRHSRVLQRHRGAWIYHCARPRLLEVPISTKSIDVLEQELDNFAGPAKGYRGSLGSIL